MNVNTSDSASPAAVESTGGDVKSSAVQVQESSESGGKEETEAGMILKSNFPSRFTRLVKDPESIRPRVLMEKRLHRWNVAGNLNRFPIEARMTKEPFLREEEEEDLKSGKVMAVTVIEPNGEAVSSLKLRLRGPSYVLHGAWKYVVARNRHAIKRGRVLRIWYFRVDGGLWFALEVEKSEEEKNREIAKRNLEIWYKQNVFSFW